MGDTVPAIFFNKKSTLKLLHLCLFACPGLAMGGASRLEGAPTAAEGGGGTVS